ncbi:MAG: hypothetical protein GY909_07660 [Oligoflexia bacterium]|nr:hypothetical protein [Oligoflexia bacterium]
MALNVKKLFTPDHPYVTYPYLPPKMQATNDELNTKKEKKDRLQEKLMDKRVELLNSDKNKELDIV